MTALLIPWREATVAQLGGHRACREGTLGAGCTGSQQVTGLQWQVYSSSHGPTGALNSQSLVRDKGKAVPEDTNRTLEVLVKARPPRAV